MTEPIIEKEKCQACTNGRFLPDTLNSKCLVCKGTGIEKGKAEKGRHLSNGIVGSLDTNKKFEDDIQPTPQILTAEETEMVKNAVSIDTYEKVRKIVEDYYVHKKKLKSSLKEILGEIESFKQTGNPNFIVHAKEFNKGLNKANETDKNKEQTIHKC